MLKQEKNRIFHGKAILKGEQDILLEQLQLNLLLVRKDVLQIYIHEDMSVSAL